MHAERLEGGDPLTAEELEEKEQLLEEVSKILYELGFEICLFIFCVDFGIWWT